MSLGTTDRDRLAYDLAQSDFDAAERDGYRAEWTADNASVVVRSQEGGEELVYDAEDLVRAASDREVQNARDESA
jgi:hypothetical protein